MLEGKKQGSSDHIDRIDLIEQFIKYLSKSKIECVIGDSEFIGKKWINWLKNEEISYVMNLRPSQHIANAQGEMTVSKLLFTHLKPGESLKLGKRKISKKESYFSWISGIRLLNGQLIILASDETIKDPCSIYKLRWGIETLFKALKSGGFNLEDTHITDADRVEVLLGVVVMSYTLAFITGQRVVEKNGMVVKNHGYKIKSFVREGIDFIISLLKNFTKKFSIIATLFKKSIALLSEYTSYTIVKFVL